MKKCILVFFVFLSLWGSFHLLCYYVTRPRVLSSEVSRVRLANFFNLETESILRHKGVLGPNLFHSKTYYIFEISFEDTDNLWDRNTLMRQGARTLPVSARMKNHFSEFDIQWDARYEPYHDDYTASLFVLNSDGLLLYIR